MADVQLENGFTRIANQILDEVAICKFNGTEFRVIMTIWRFTYGFNRKEHSMSTNFIADAIGADNSRVRKVLKDLIDSNVVNVVKEATFNQSRVLSFNKNFNEWKVKKDTRGNKSPHQSNNTQQEGSKTTQQEGSKSTPKKESIKDIYKDITTTDSAHGENLKNEDEVAITDSKKILNKFLELKGSIHFSPKDEMAAKEIERENIPLEKVLKYLEDCFSEYEKRKKHGRDRINGLDYCVGYIFDRHYSEKEEKSNVTRIHQFRGGDARGFKKGTSYEQALRESELARRTFNC